MMSRDRFGVLLAALIVAYLFLQAAYVVRQPLIVDEFAGAAEVHRLTHGVPYRDYLPYKTVLGYAIQGIAAALTNEAWTRFIAIKLQMAAINAAMLAVAGIWLARLYGRRPALMALLVMICSSIFLERSSELRVDMLTAWLGVLSLLALLDRKPGWAGAFLALSFGVSQKAALYAVAADAAFLALLAGSSRETRRENRTLKSFFTFNAVFAGGVLLYVAIWSVPSSFRTVVLQVFGAMGDAAGLDLYEIRWWYWRQTLIRNPAMFVLAGIALWRLGRRSIRDRLADRDAFLAIFAIGVLAQAAWYPTPWPYFFVIVWPTLLVLHAAAFQVFLSMEVPARTRIAAYAALTGVAVIYPLLRLPVMFSRDNGYQRHSIELADFLVGPGDTYLAAAPLLPHRKQSVARLAWVDAVAITRLRKESPAGLNAIVAELERTPPKVLIANYRIYGLPPAIRIWLERHYARLAGSVYTYAPMIGPGQAVPSLAFAGRYRVELQQQTAALRVDGQVRRNGDLLELTKGAHALVSPTGVRLRMLPHGVEQHLDADYLAEQVFLPNLYDE
jgi:hypothetical protein